MISATQPITLKVRSIPCTVIQGNFHKRADLSKQQLQQAAEKFRVPPADEYLYLIAIDDERVIARQHVNTFTKAELVAIDAH